MDNYIIYIIIGIVALAIGFFIAKLLEKNNASQVVKQAKKSAASILKEAKADAEAIKKEKILQAKEKFTGNL